ncbi:MAG: hypothetical protein IKC59_02735 [Clostridia bacterium]|nr:hypothetical protein [Clostridia bacterium]
MTSNRILQTALIVVFAICTLFSAFISVLACIPIATDVEIRETVKASASKLSAETDSLYQIEVSGALKNTTDAPIAVERLEIVLQAGKNDPELLCVIENIEIPARATVTVAKSEFVSLPYDKIGGITATVNGESIYLRNPAQTSPTVALIPLALTAVFTFLLVRACKVRYYMYQEDRYY